MSHQTHPAVTAPNWRLEPGCGSAQCLGTPNELARKTVPQENLCCWLSDYKLLMTPQNLEELQPCVAGQLSVQAT